ncbi:subtilisin-like protein [Mytilinidion resinicola]|uniref:Subtilisin-like protein n=1 Tax=Mytilinidion resinicola TaxID=574789 RepID=A0A6A6Y8N4_9PEZI|nr:subtilisin-like protein [Mytilinidion resinicola]KAF2804923.1 subtilisin-like protein [Mytilinidion resinicola]
MDYAPIPLSTALKNNLLSSTSKIQLAFTLSKAFWQYYESDWMRAAWNFQTVQLLPQRDEDERCGIATLDCEAEVPFLKIDTISPDGPFFSEYEPQNQRMHRYPYILNLCLLLVLLCTEQGSPHESSPTQNRIYSFCAMKIKHKQSVWPVIELSDERKRKYKEIVRKCLPNPREDICLSLAERRAWLRDNVVRPLYELLQDMQCSDTDDAPETEEAGLQTNPQIDMDEIAKTPSNESRRWINNIKFSPMQRYICQELKNDKKGRRPKIAIIDTGYDGEARWLDNPFKNRLSQKDEAGTISQNWKDFWENNDQPQDDSGHGTSMLYTVMNIAPFADVCVARIAGNSEDLRQEDSRTTKNLADAIRWAAEVQEADIISLSLGWEQEKLVEGRYVISNVIFDALGKRNQKVLLFAAASNYGGGRYELFPAKHPNVFSIRATNALGKHEDFNPPLPDDGSEVVGTLGVGVPTKERTHEETGRTGTSVATAVAAGFAAIVVAYINIHGEGRLWEGLRTHTGFTRLLREGISTEPEARKRFVTLEKLYGNNWKRHFESCLDGVTSRPN